MTIDTKQLSGNKKQFSGANKSFTDKKPKSPRKISERYLHNAALAYLARFSSCSENLRRILHRKINKSCAFHGEPTPEEGFEMADKVIKRFCESLLLDDALYAKSAVTSLRRRGLSKRGILAKLQQKGLSAEQVNHALYTVDQLSKEDNDIENPELLAGYHLARRRRLGPFRIKDREERAQKDLAAFARAGFSYEISKKIIFATPDELSEF